MQRKTLPASIVIGVVMGFFGTAAYAASALAVFRGDDDFPSYQNIIRWQMFSHGTAIAGALLVATGLFALSKRLNGTSRTLVQIAAWANLAWAAWSLVRPALFELLPKDTVTGWFGEYGWRVIAAAVWCAWLVLTIAARAWTRPRSPLVTICAIALLLLEAVTWAPYVATWLFSLYEDHRTIYELMWPLREALSALALLGVVHAIVQDGTTPLPDPNLAAASFKGAEITILVRVASSIGLALLGLGIAKSATTLKIVLVLGPAIGVAATLAFVWSLLSVERAELPGMPRIRLLLGVALTTWTIGIQSMQTLVAYQLLSDDDSFSSAFLAQQAETWSILAPIIGVVGIVLVCSAISAFALTRSAEQLRQTAMTRGIIYAILMGVVILVPLGTKNFSGRGSAMFVSLTLAICAISALVQLAGVFKQAAAAIELQPKLPEARLRS